MKPDIKALELEVEKINPRFFISEEKLPAITEWEVGGEYELEIKVKMVGKMEDTDMPTEARFEILEVESDDVSKMAKRPEMPEAGVTYESKGNVTFVNKRI